MKNEIRALDALEILDSRGNPTIEAALVLNYGAEGTAAVPSGASTGGNEAVELRDGGKRYGGKGVLHAVKNVREVVAKAVVGQAFADQRAFDHALIELDGTENKSRLGANTLLACSMAFARASAAAAKVPLYRHLSAGDGNVLPVPCLNVINGGRHADNSIDFQEFKIVPHKADSFAESIRIGEEVFHALKSRLQKMGLSTAVGDEGGFAPDLRSNEQAVELILDAIVLAGYKPGKEVSLALDPATSEMVTEDGKYRRFKSDKKTMTTEQMIELWETWLDDYPIVLLEDPLGENDWNGWTELTRRVGHRVELVGDDIFCTNPRLVQKGIDQAVANSVLIKPNQIGTVTETLDCVRLANANGYRCYVSHRSGETEDTFIADLAVAIGCGHLKTGSGCRGERTAKFNRLLRIQHELGSAARFPGLSAFHPSTPAKDRMTRDRKPADAA